MAARIAEDGAPSVIVTPELADALLDTITVSPLAYVTVADSFLRQALPTMKPHTSDSVHH